jgi:hypothetical protein
LCEKYANLIAGTQGHSEWYGNGAEFEGGQIEPLCIWDGSQSRLIGFQDVSLLINDIRIASMPNVLSKTA